MKDLSWLRKQGRSMNEIDQTELKNMTIAQSLEILDMLYESARPLLDATEHLYRRDRETYLTNLQKRLYRLKKWKQRHE